MDAVTVVGALAAICSTASFVPQAWRVIRTRETDAISLRMYLLTVAGFALWLAFGIFRREWPLIVPNAICLALASFILVMKVLPPAKRAAVASSLDPQA